MNLILKIFLWLPSKLYQIVVWVRNLLFDKHLIKSTSFATPIIFSVGNIAVGGTGKTPHVEYLIRLLAERYRLAVLSRGYKRKTKGYLLANDLETVTAKEIGDEPYQIYSKHRDLLVAVDADRVEGVKRLKERTDSPDVILLDDAFQHRYLRPHCSIVLCDYSRPPLDDHLLPMGRLREPLSALQRADAVVVTKCPKKLTAEELKLWHQKLHLLPTQPIFSSVISYDHLVGANGTLTLDQLKTKHQAVVLVTGIANPEPLCDYLTSHEVEVNHLAFSDHHNFSAEEIQTIEQTCGSSSLLLTTEKDFVRLKTMLSSQLLDRTFVLPIHVEFSEGFDRFILSQL